MSPFKSQQQRAWMHVNKPEMAKEWEKHTPKNKKLPKKVKKKSSILYGLCNYFYKAAGVVDVSDRFHQKQISNKLQQVEQDPTGIAQLPELDKARQRSLNKEIRQATNVWQHRFSNVKKDAKGFFILKSESPSSKDMKVGDTLADDQLNMTPYWEITDTASDRISLKPIGSNPFLTGVGAGGAKLTDYDIGVFTGEHEKKRAERIQQMLQAGTASLDDVKYVLLGTVPVHMGPNGSQGGWYSVDDRHNRGHIQGLNTQQIMVHDAKKLKELGFEVPKLALSGDLDVGKWSGWMEGDYTQDYKYVPKDPEAYIGSLKRLTDKGKFRYDDDSLEEKRREFSVEKTEAHWDAILEDFLHLSKKEFELKHPYLPHNLQDLFKMKEHYANKVKRNLESKDDLHTEQEDNSEASILRNIYSKERRVSLRNITKLIDMCYEDERYIKYLHDLIKNGGAPDFLTNEKVLSFFNLMDDIEGLRLGLEHLKDPTNRRYAYGYLLQQKDIDFAKQYFTKEDSMEAIRGFLGAFVDQYMSKYGERGTEETRKSDKAALKQIINFCEQGQLLEKIETQLSSSDIYEKHEAQEALGAIRSAISRLGLAYLNEEEIEKYFADFLDFVKKVRELSQIK